MYINLSSYVYSNILCILYKLYKRSQTLSNSLSNSLKLSQTLSNSLKLSQTLSNSLKLSQTLLHAVHVVETDEFADEGGDFVFEVSSGVLVIEIVVV